MTEAGTRDQRSSHIIYIYICYILAAYADVDTAAYHDGGRDKGPEE